MTDKRYIHVTDHAVLRYLERVHGVDMNGLRKRIGRMVHNAVLHGANGVRINGVSFRLVDNHVITVRPKREPQKRRNRKIRSRGRSK